MTPHVKFKPGAGIETIAPAGIRILAAIDQCARFLEIVVTITSGSEARGRSALDPHMTGEAFDISVHGFSYAVMRAMVRNMKSTLGAAFTVLLEGPPMSVTPPELKDILYVNPKATALHIHIQRKKATTWPPKQSN